MQIFILTLFFQAIFAISIFAGCPFCNNEIIQRQLVAESDKAWVLYCLTPATDGNLLIIPKRHMTRFEELSNDEAADIFHLIQKTQAVFKKRFGLTDYLLVQKNGKNAGQSVDHIHIHAMPCPDDFDPKRVNMYRAPITRDEMRDWTADLKPYFLEER